MQDDILDLTGTEFAKKKGGLGQDITEGKRTLMVIRSLKTAAPKDRKRLIEILNMHTSDQKLRDEAIAIMQKNKAFDYVKKKADSMVEDSWKAVDKLLKESEGKEKLKAFAEFLIKRSI
jgi:geranylgeranyl pyrophosphate synthase